MISAGVPVPLDLFYGQKIEKGWRDGLHEQFDEWLNTLEEGMEGKEGKLDEIVGEIFKMRQELTGIYVRVWMSLTLLLLLKRSNERSERLE
ncbi:MAG: hypothetical protein QMD80_05900 [archaeon]|nr:hypothetical protein [archaeon]